jgi:Zn-dependent peptidase ImmA (M78 family)
MIDGQRVRLARELHRMNQGRFVEEVPDLSQPQLSRIENGRSLIPPDGLTAAAIAAVTGVTVEWLARPASAGLSGLSPHFRARSRVPEITKASGVAWANVISEAHDCVADRVRRIPIRLERYVHAEPAHTAHLIRRLLDFDPFEPLPYLILAVERLGVRVLGLPWREPTVDAFCAWGGPIPVIAIAANVPGDRIRWTVAHELGHLVLHEPSDRGQPIEDQADAFASELLTPIDALRLSMPAHPTLQTLTMLKSQWGVSIKSLVRRAREMGIIDNDRATSLYRQISSRGWNRAEPGYVPREKPRALRKKFEIALGRGNVTQVAREMAWSIELTQLVLDQHATADELPMLSDMRPARSSDNVIVPMRRPERRRA